MVAVLGYSRDQIFEAVKDMYTAVADAPASPFHFPVGEPAGRALGYPKEAMRALPRAVRDSFAGVGYPFSGNAVSPGDTVLDLGAGAGADTLIAARLAGRDGHVMALDLTPAMTRKLKRESESLGTRNISVLQASAERLPLADESVDAITSNGALNLVPDKRRAVTEMFRVLRPGGKLQIADVVIHRPVTADCSEDPRLWVECVVGASVDEDFVARFREAGFEDVRVMRTNDYFAHSPSAQTREIAASFGARSMELTMRRGARTPGRLQRWFHRLNPKRMLTRLWRGGLLGAASLGLAITACYGTLAAAGLLGALGVRLGLDQALWAGTIALFTVATAVTVGTGIRSHGRYGPTTLAVAAAGVVLFALYIHYHMLIEGTGFALLAAAVGWDIVLRQREQARVLGLSSKDPLEPSSDTA